MEKQVNKFDIYMQLGNRLEQNNKMMMAYAAYLEAVKLGGTNEKEILNTYLLLVAKKISKVAKERNEELRTQLLEWLRKGEISFAIACLNNICEELAGIQWMDTENAVLYRCLAICQAECEQGINSWWIEGKDMEELKNWYYQLKFMVRRMDMGFSDDAELIEYMEKQKISTAALCEMIDTICYFPQRVYGYMVKVFRHHEMKRQAEFFEMLWNGMAEDGIENTEISEDVMAGKVAFIIAVNEEEIYQEAVYYIQHLKVPKQMEIEIIPVRGAASIAAAYNQGMQMTNARYKIYMHQDVMLVNQYMLYEMCHIFQDECIGMIGVAGTSCMPENGIWWESERPAVFCKLYQDMIMEHNLSSGNYIAGESQEVEAIDGVMMITQYDIPWREDLHLGWHFYDISHSMEFGKKNLKIVIPKQDKVWCMHEQKWNKEAGKEYLEAREKFLEEYKDMLER